MPGLTALIGTGRSGRAVVDLVGTNRGTAHHWSRQPVATWHNNLIGPHFSFKFKYSHLNLKTSRFYR
jgi:hypothetical protein